MLEDAVDHLIHSVMPAAAEYEAAENELSAAYKADPTPAAWEDAARTVKRRAANVAIAIDGLTDRCAAELGLTKPRIRADLSALCTWSSSGAPRNGAHGRVRGVANAYKHQHLNDPNLPITSEADILVVGLGWGFDGWGVGKCGGVETLVQEKSGTSFKFLGDVPTAIAAWFNYLGQNGAKLSGGPYQVCGLQVQP